MILKLFDYIQVLINFLEPKKTKRERKIKNRNHNSLLDHGNFEEKHNEKKKDGKKTRKQKTKQNKQKFI